MLRGAEYNPRTIGDAEKRKLRDAIKRHGMVQPIVWNRQTGNVVGGHQRLSILDTLAGTSDYRLTVAVVDVPLKREKEINLLLNNAAAMGDWDLGLLGDVLRDVDDLIGTGFDHADVFQLIGDSPFENAEDEEYDELAKKIRETRELYSSIAEKSRKRDGDDFFFLAIFRNGADRDAFLEKAGLTPGTKYQSGEELARLCGIENFREAAD